MNDETGQTNNLTGKFTMKLSKLNQIQRYMTSFELDYMKFEYKPQRHKPNNKFLFTTKEVFETLKAADVDTTTTLSSNMIEPIFNRNFGNTFHHHNGPNHCQRANKHTYQHYQPRPLQISKNVSPRYPKEKNWMRNLQQGSERSIDAE